MKATPRTSRGCAVGEPLVPGVVLLYGEKLDREGQGFSRQAMVCIEDNHLVGDFEDEGRLAVREPDDIAGQYVVGRISSRDDANQVSAALTVGRDLFAFPVDDVQSGQYLKTIPGSGERIPAMGLGSASSFMQAARSEAEHAELQEVLRLFSDLGGAVVDTASRYGASA